MLNEVKHLVTKLAQDTRFFSRPSTVRTSRKDSFRMTLDNRMLLRGTNEPVSRVLYPSSTGRTVAISLALPLPEGSSDLPQGRSEAGRPLPCYLVLHRMGFARHRCRHRSGELLPHLFTLVLPRTEGRCSFCGTFRMHRFSPAHPGRYPASCPVELGLSSSFQTRWKDAATRFICPP